MASEQAQKLYAERLGRINAAIALEKTDKVPLAPFFSQYSLICDGSNYRDLYYDHDKVVEATVKFFKKYPILDAAMAPLIYSGPGHDLLQSQMVDWPGRAGTRVPDTSSHQILEMASMEPEEYPEMLADFTGFAFRKWLPRFFKGLSGLENVNLNPAGGGLFPATTLGSLVSPSALEALKTLIKYAEHAAEENATTMKLGDLLAEEGFPGFITGLSEAPYDILGDYFRGTMGIFEDLTDPDMQGYMEEAVNLFADQQIKQLAGLQYAPLPYKRVFFPLHKGMDGFMSDEQYERLYWKPLKKIMMFLIDIGVTPFIYTEGPYNTRLDFLADVPKGKVIYHFEKVDMKRAKEKLGGIACISGNLSVAELEFGKKEAVIESTKKLLDTCMPGGGYIFDFDGSLENCKQENLDAMFEVLEKESWY